MPVPITTPMRDRKGANIQSAIPLRPRGHMLKRGADVCAYT